LIDKRSHIERLDFLPGDQHGNLEAIIGCILPSKIPGVRSSCQHKDTLGHK
jgi:hypothetical protein